MRGKGCRIHVSTLAIRDRLFLLVALKTRDSHARWGEIGIMRFLGVVRRYILGLAAVLAWALPVVAQQAEYRLHPGDRLSMSMPGLTAQTWESTIDMTGRAHFPFLGAVPAAGLTLPELSLQIEIAATGMEVPIFDGGRPVTSMLSGDDVFVQVARYRPVTVVGDVAQPGTVEFMPGQTVRAVLGTAGGFRLADLALTRVPADATVRLQTALQTKKWLTAQVARTDLLLNVGDEVSELTPEQRNKYLQTVMNSSTFWAKTKAHRLSLKSNWCSATGNIPRRIWANGSI
mgnify:CR=1 FL=1